jgi:hypothetical protein
VTGRACSAIFATGAMTGKTTAATGAMTGKTTAATGARTGKTTAATGAMTGKTTAATGATTGKTAVAGRGCSGNRELDDQGGHAVARSVPWHLPTAGARGPPGGSGHGCDS